MKIALIVIGIVIIGALFVIQDFGSQTITDPVQSQPTSKPASQPTPEPAPIPEPASIPEPTTQPKQIDCDPSYPAICISPYPPDLDCGEIGYSNFRVVPPDPHGFDRDRDGTGCEVGSSQSSKPVQPTQEKNCDPSYPDVCIAAYPPDLDCGEIGFSNFRVIQPDPHGFDGDKDGIGCEVGSSQSSKPVQPTQENNCDPSYPTVCIPSPPPDLDCGEIGYSNFKVLQPDPHRFDGDKDGIGCES